MPPDTKPKTSATAVVVHTVIQGLVWTLPLFLLAFPHLGDLTISAALSLVVSYLNQKLTNT